MNIYVSNLSFNVQDEELSDYFASFGEVSSAKKVITDGKPADPEVLDLLKCLDDTAAQNAIQQLDNSTVDGRQMRVSEEAKPKTEKDF